MNPYTWRRTELYADGSADYVIERGNGPLIHLEFPETLPFHSWILANWCDQLHQIEQADRAKLRAVATAADQTQRARENSQATHRYPQPVSGTVSPIPQTGSAPPASGPTPGQT